MKYRFDFSWIIIFNVKSSEVTWNAINSFGKATKSDFHGFDTHLEIVIRTRS